MRRRTATALTALAVLAASACSGEHTTSDPSAVEGLRVASFDFVESELLAEVYAQAAESAGVPVVRLGAVGPREVVVPAMRNGLIDLVPEYLGSALRFSGVTESPVDSSEAALLLDERVEQYGIDVLAASSAVDSNVFVVSEATAELHGLVAVSDLAGASLERFGGPAECPERPLCLLGLEETYEVTFEEFVVQPSLAFTAEALRRGEIDVGLMFSTSPELDARDIIALDDDRRLQPPENVVPMLRRDVADRWRIALLPTLDGVSKELMTADLRQMNGLVADGAEVGDVAREWLSSVE